MRCNFVVGQKVVCVNGAWAIGSRTGPQVQSGPKSDGIYVVDVVRAIGDDIFVGLREFKVLAGYPNPIFCHESFRPLQERKTDISIFQALLNPVKQREDA